MESWGCIRGDNYRCGVPQCGGTGRRAKCRNRWCEFDIETAAGVVAGRGKLHRESQGVGPCVCTVNLSAAVPTRGEGDHCLELCSPTAAGLDREVPCPRLSEEDIIVKLTCPVMSCSYSTYGFMAEHREHLEAHPVGERERESHLVRLIAQERDRIKADAAATDCTMDGCRQSVVGARELYKHYLQAHWHRLPGGKRLYFAAQAALAAGRHRLLGGGVRQTVVLRPEGRRWREAAASEGRTADGLPHCAAGLLDRCPSLQRHLTGIEVAAAGGVAVAVTFPTHDGGRGARK